MFKCISIRMGQFCLLDKFLGGKFFAISLGFPGTTRAVASREEVFREWPETTVFRAYYRYIRSHVDHIHFAIVISVSMNFFCSIDKLFVCYLVPACHNTKISCPELSADERECVASSPGTIIFYVCILSGYKDSKTFLIFKEKGGIYGVLQGVLSLPNPARPHRLNRIV